MPYKKGVGCRSGGAVLLLLLCAVGDAQTPPPPQPAGPTIRFTQPETDATLGAAYRSALDNLLRINTVPWDSGPKPGGYDQTGLLRKTPGTFIRAGGGYTQPWTRDASVNSWNAASLLEPDVARNTLWAVVKRRHGKLIVQQDNQWWDQTIWVVAAWNHFLVTGDRAFLANAYQTATDTLRRDKKKHYDKKRGLYEGPAFLNDGIAGYPAPPADAGETRGSFVLRYHGAKKIMVLSTNCIYAEAYRSAARMAAALGRPGAESQALAGEADRLTGVIRQAFWIPAKGRFGYLLHADGTLDDAQEGSGMAFALLLGIATPEQAASLLKTAVIEPHGIADVAPSFPRFSETRPGRHNVIIWPPIEAFWADAAARAGSEPVFAREVETLAALAAGSGGHFWEIYNAATGVPDGGWQVGHQWESQPDQTWSATGYLRMIDGGLFGMRFGVDGLTFAPTLPGSWGAVSLSGLRYRGATLTVRLKGAGQVVQSVTLDGIRQKYAFVPAALTGNHIIEVEVK